MVSNESREVNAYRIRNFKLDGFVDCFISSFVVDLRKPDSDIFRLALDISQAPARQVVNIENTPMFVQIAEGMGIEVFFTRITSPPARSWLPSDCSMTKPNILTSILTINGGSSSIKFALDQTGEPLKRGLYGKVDRIGPSGTNPTFDDPPTRIGRKAANWPPPITNRQRVCSSIG